jgi:hypothetical protein
VTIVVKMLPDEGRGTKPNLILSLSEVHLNELKPTAKKLKIGSHIEFDATMMSLGSSNDMHHMHVFDLRILDDDYPQKLPGYVKIGASRYRVGKMRVKS